MLNRMLGMIYLLMNKGTVTAAELAERFEVSVRTIYRDVETLSMAGIPVYARKGKNGGISITREFVLDKMLVTRQEQTQILSALESLKETGALKEEEILIKLGDFFRAEPLNWVSIDFSDWSGRRGELYGQIREAILFHNVLVFDYYGQYGGMSHREVEPVQLLFREYTWYLRAFCRTRQEMRLFKVLRMKRVERKEESFTPRAEEGRQIFPEQICGNIAGDVNVGGGSVGDGNPGGGNVCGGGDADAVDATGKAEADDVPADKTYREIVLRIDKKEAWRVYDRFEEDQITVLADGSFEIRMCCQVDDWVYGVILSFGPSARVLGPGEIIEEIRSRIQAMGKLYEEKGEEKVESEKF